MRKLAASLVVLLSVFGGVVATSAPIHAAPARPQSCTWTFEASAGPFFYNGTGYQNVEIASIDAYADLCTGTGWNGEEKTIMVGYTGNTSECNYAFSSRLEEDGGSTHLNPAGQGSTTGCFDSSTSRDADDEVTVSSPISTGLSTTHCDFDGSAYVSAFFAATYSNSGPFCP